MLKAVWLHSESGRVESSRCNLLLSSLIRSGPAV